MTISGRPDGDMDCPQAGHPFTLIREVISALSAPAVDDRTARAHALKVLLNAETASWDEKRVGLTAREVDIMRYLLMGMKNKDIARSLFISENTVRFHVSSILRKKKARSRLDLVILCR